MRRGPGLRSSRPSSSQTNDSSALPSCSLLISTLILVIITVGTVVYFNAHHHLLEHATASQHTSAKDVLRGSSGHSRIEDLKDYVQKLEDVVYRLEQSRDGQLSQAASQSDEAPMTIKNIRSSRSESTVHDRANTRNVHRPMVSDVETGVEVAVAQAEEADPGANADDATKAWLSRLTSKLQCMWLHCGAIYLYHTRKAAGTSVREILSFAARQWRVPYYETEGIVLHRPLIDYSGVLTVTSLRDPIKRVLSLYWYEHVGWFDGVLHKAEKCKPLREWLDAWRDGSSWKSAFVAKNPGSVYVEVSNYYTKMLSGWQGEPLSAEHLQNAKEALRAFDVVLLSDWMGDDTQVDAMNALFPGREKASAGKLVQGDFNARVKLTPRLAPDEEKMKGVIREINGYDLQLWEYAQSLMAYRLKLVAPAISAVKRRLGIDLHQKFVDPGAARNAALLARCRGLQSSPSRQVQKRAIGIFQPPGHKGPF